MEVNKARKPQLRNLKYRINSGDFEIIVQEQSFQGAANLAIQLYDISSKSKSKKLGLLTAVCCISSKNQETTFFGTERLLANNTSGNYSKIE